MKYTRLTIALSDFEMNALQAHAQDNLRNPREHARYLLRGALGLNEESRKERKKKESGAVVVQTAAHAL